MAREAAQLGKDSFRFDRDTRPELPKLEAIEDLSAAVGRSGSGEAVMDLSGLGEVALELRPEKAVGNASERVESPLRLVRVEAERRSGIGVARWWQLALKRALDIMFSLVLLAVTLPVLVVVAIAIGVSSRGPILFRQRRVGWHGKSFGMLKFRSMRHEAHDGRDELLHLNEATGPVFKIRNDPRITPVGRVIRRWSIDELPQLVNVLLGQMSLVGPRPPLPEEYAIYGPRERERLSVRPGLTCIWQVSGRSELDFETWMAMDLEYISSWSLGLDLKLLAQTLPAVVRGRGAY